MGDEPDNSTDAIPRIGLLESRRRRIGQQAESAVVQVRILLSAAGARSGETKKPAYLKLLKYLLNFSGIVSANFSGSYEQVIFNNRLHKPTLTSAALWL